LVSLHVSSITEIIGNLVFKKDSFCTTAVKLLH